MAGPVLRRSVEALAALALAAALAAGCGDDGGAAGGELDGRALFLGGTTPSCGSCHALDAAGSTAEVGPDLSGTFAPDWFIAQTIRDGYGAMPSFEDQLTDAEIDAIARFVAPEVDE